MVTTWKFVRWFFGVTQLSRRVASPGLGRGAHRCSCCAGAAGRGCVYSIALTMSSTTFLASPKTIIVLSM